MSELFIKDESSNHKYRTELPNIIFEIGLSPRLLGVYSAIKRAAGDNGYCSKSERNLAKQLLITPKTLRGFISKLCEPNEYLKKPLIISKKRFSESGDKDTSLITINDIWPENYRLFTKDHGGEVIFTSPGVKITGRGVKITEGVGEKLPQGGVKITDKEEPFKKNPLKKNIPPSSSDISKTGGWVEDKDFKKKLVDLLNTCKKLNLPFSDHGIYQAMKESSPYAVQEMLKAFSQRPAENKILKFPDRWLLSEAIKKHEIELIKQDYK